MVKMFKSMLGVMLLMVGMLAGCGGGGAGDVATAPAPSGSSALVASDLTAPANIYAVNSSGCTSYKFNSDGSLLASATVTAGTPTTTTIGGWSIATDNRTLALVIPGSPQQLYTLASRDASGQFWIMTDSSGEVSRFYFNLAAAQAWYASLQPQAPGALTAFTTGTFSGRTLYYVSGNGYQQGRFDADGNLMASAMVTSGAPGALTKIGTWNVPADGTLRIVNMSNQAITYTLLNDDTANRYYRTSKASSGTVTVTTGWYYDPYTGLSQAQAFTSSGAQP